MEGLHELTNNHCPGGVTQENSFSSSQRLEEHFSLFSVDTCWYIMTSTSQINFHKSGVNFTSESPVSCLLLCSL